MGRAMLIICTGMLVILGIIGISTADQGKQLTQNAVKYANETTAQNAAHTAIQRAMYEINLDESWPTKHEDEESAWDPTIDGATIELYVERNSDYSTNGYWEEDELRIISRATYADGYQSEVISVYLKQPLSSLVPDFTGAIQFASNNIIPSFGGSASINGTDQSGQCSELEIPDDMPEVSVKGDITDTKYQDVQNEYDNLKDSPGGVEKVDGLNYEPTDELIARLENSGNAIEINGNYQNELGSPENPGVFFINEGTNLTGKQSKGYGIMVIRSDATMTYDGELKVAGNFDFHGLVIFENAFNFVGRGTPTIYGSVLVGHTQDFLDDPTVAEEDKQIDVDLSGNIHVQYDCQGQSFAKMAAASAVQQNKYTRVVTYE